ncbi:MAG: phosphoribosyltransferase [Myxococcota bacterium]
MRTRFRNRVDAGRALAAELVKRPPGGSPLVLGLPRGGVPVAFEVARALGAPLDVLVVRKLGAPMQPELAMGAIASGGVRVLNADVLRMLGLGMDDVARVQAHEARILAQREQMWRGARPWPELRGRTVILVDDGLATGATMRVAIHAARQHGADRIVAAVPVGAPQTCELLRDEADEVVCLHREPDFVAVGAWYDDFSETPDGEVRRLLEVARSWSPEEPELA